MYLCTKCYWSGTKLKYAENGQGECPVCGTEFVGCVSEEKYNEIVAELEELPTSTSDNHPAQP